MQIQGKWQVLIFLLNIHRVVANWAFVVQLQRVCSGFSYSGCEVQLALCLTSSPRGPACNLSLWRSDNPQTKAYWLCHSHLCSLLYDCWWAVPDIDGDKKIFLPFKGVWFPGFKLLWLTPCRQSECFEVSFEVMRQLREIRKSSAGFPGEPVCERHDWTQNPRGKQRPFHSGGLDI